MIKGWLSRSLMLLSAMFIATFCIVQYQHPVLALPGGISRNGSQLTLNGKPYTFTGINAYQLATYWSVNEGCGQMLSDAEMDAFFGSLRPNSVVRFWVFQDQAINKTTGQRDWTGIDRVFGYAKKHNQMLLPTIGNHWQECDGGAVKNDAWYNGGYKQPFSPDGKTSRISYEAYMKEVVGRYKESSALGMWSLLNEPEMSCGKATELKNFFDTLGSELKGVDPDHLIEMGVIGTNQCSLVGNDYATVLSSPMVDVATYHDYGDETSALPTTPAGSSLQIRIAQAKAANKPIIVGEAGVKGNNGVAGCNSLAVRNERFKAKMSAAFNAGVSGYLPWNWSKTNTVCDYDITPDDPTMELLRTITLSNGSVSGGGGTTTSTPATTGAQASQSKPDPSKTQVTTVAQPQTLPATGAALGAIPAIIAVGSAVIHYGFTNRKSIG